MLNVIKLAQVSLAYARILQFVQINIVLSSMVQMLWFFYAYIKLYKLDMFVCRNLSTYVPKIV